jgi:PAS domain S-box-containing protein
VDDGQIQVHLARGPRGEMSEEQRIHSDLREAGERFELLLNSIEDYAIFMLDLDGRVASWNNGAARINGYSADEIVGQHFSLLYTKDDQAACKPERELEQALAQGRAEEEGWRVRKDGSQYWANVVITPMRDQNGKPIGFARVACDMSARRQAEEKLRNNEEQFRRLVEGVEEYAIYMLDPMGNVATWNSGAQKIKQYSASEIVGKNFACFYTVEDVSEGKPQHNLKQARVKGHIHDKGLRVRKDGSTFHAEVVLTAVRDESGNIRGFSKVTHDVTDQVRAREIESEKIAAEQANKAKDDFLAALSHELRTPLTPALAAASYLAENAAKFPTEFSEDLDTIRRNVQLQARLIDDLLDLTRVTRGKIDLHFERVDAHAVLREALEIAQAGIGEKALKLSIELKAEKHHIWADPVRIQQVFWNLINNAVKFTGPGGGITIRTSNDQHDHFELAVSDTGIGIEAQRQSSLFKAFEQGELAITRQFGGLGLGLAISKNLIDLHHGVITVESRGRSFGATFKVILDVVKDRVGQSGVAARLPDRPAKSLRILLVEDHGDTRKVLARLLSHFGHQISVADSTQAALDFVGANDFDVVLSDIGLPDGSGYEIISQAKLRKPVKGVALTGFGTDEDIRRSKEAGFDFHLTKPVDVHELRSVLSQVGA